MKSTEENTTDAPKPTYRSRWVRFSPAMGWKSFFSEIVIVVLGVMIALAANEVVENWNWQIKVRAGEVRLRDDLQEAFEYAAEAIMFEPCVDAQLADMAANLLSAGNTLRPLPRFSDKTTHGFVVRYPDRPFTFPVWEALLANGTVSHFPEIRQKNYAQISTQLINIKDRNADMTRASGRFSVMAYPIALDAVLRKDLLIEIEEQRFRNRNVALIARQLMQVIDDLKMAPTPEVVDIANQESGTVQFCKQHKKPLSDWRTYSAR